MKKPINWTCLFALLWWLTACGGTGVSTPAPVTSVDEVEEIPVPLKQDVRDDIFYFVMPDRFYNGDPANDQGSPDLPVSAGGFDPASKRAFHGGDLQGLEAKLEYLKDMGITAIWMTPILRNKAVQQDGIAHHGYWIVDFTQIDPHFGSNADLKNLIASAHSKGIKVFFDIITNHTADVIKYRQCHNPDGSFKAEKTCVYKTLAQKTEGDTYTPFIPDGEQQIKSPEWLNDPAYYNNQGDSLWRGESAIQGDFSGLDDLNTADPQVVAGFIAIYKRLISEFKPDGFRIDTVKHVDLSFWQAFAPAILAHAKAQGIENFHIFGEVYSSDPQELSLYTTAGNLPSVLDFGFQHAAAEAFFRNKGPGAIKQLFVNDDFYNDADSEADLLMNFLGNHDMGRPGLFINQALTGISDGEKLRRTLLAHAFMYFSRGIPVIYYGDEQGFTGDGNDIDAREDMFPSQVGAYNDNDLIGTNATTAEDNFDRQHPIYRVLASLAEIRQAHRALRRGITLPRHFNEKNKVFAIARVDADERKEYLLLMNTGTKAQSISLDALSEQYQLVSGDNEFAVAEGQIKAQLAPLSYLLIKAQDPAPVSTNLELELSSTEVLGERIKFSFELAGAQQNPSPLFEVSLALQTADNQLIPAGRDRTPPYSLMVQRKTLQQVKGLQVTVSNLSGQQASKTIPLGR